MWGLCIFIFGQLLNALRKRAQRLAGRNKQWAKQRPSTAQAKSTGIQTDLTQK